MTTRRQFLQAGLAAAAAIAFPGQKLFAQTPTKKPTFTLALQTWTLRDIPNGPPITFEEAVKITKAAGIDEIEIAGSNTWGWRPEGNGRRGRTVDLNAEERRTLRSILDDNGIRAVSLGGSQGTVQDFEFAKEFGMDFLQGEPQHHREQGEPWNHQGRMVEVLNTVSRRAEEYGIRYALHNHAYPNRFWDYQQNLEWVKDAAPALGFCPDTGHYIRSGFCPVCVVRAFKERLVSVHLKDLNGTNIRRNPEVRDRLQDVAWGTGYGQVEAVLNELVDQEFTGPVVIEYDRIFPDGNVEQVNLNTEFFRNFIASFDA